MFREGRGYRVESRDELGDQEKTNAVPSKGFFGPAIVVVRVSREAVNEVQNLLTPSSTSLVPHPISQDTGNDSQTERRDEAQLPARGQRPSRKEKQRPR